MFRQGIRMLFGLLMICSLATLALQPAAAQSEQGAQKLDLPCAIGISYSILGAGMPQTAKGQELVQVEIYFAPGGGLTAHTHPGAVVVNVESGALALKMIDMRQGQMEVHPQGATAATPASAMMTNRETVLNAGDWFVEEGMVHSMRNPGSTTAKVLVSGLIQAGQPLVQCAS